MRTRFKCITCGHAGSTSYNVDPVNSDIYVQPWYLDESGLKHLAVVCLLCGTIHDTSGSFLRGILTGFRSPLKIHDDINPMKLARIIFDRMKHSAAEARKIAIIDLGIPEQIIDVLVERMFLGDAFAREKKNNVLTEEGTADWLIITVYPSNEQEANYIDELIQETMQKEGVHGSVVVSWVMPDILVKLGIGQLPAIVVDDQVFLEGQLPTKSDIVILLNAYVPAEKRTPHRRPDRKDRWPESLEEAVTWIIDKMREEDKKAIAEADEEELRLYNGFNWGQGIRNGFGLWSGNQQLLRDCKTDNADEASFVIIWSVREKLRRYT